MTAVAEPDSWKEVCLIGVLPDGGSEVQWGAMTEDITGFDFGDKDVESTATVSGGRITKFTPQGDESVTMKVFPVTALKDGSGVVQWFHPQTTDDATPPILVDNTRTRTPHALIFLWATTLPATAGAIPTAGVIALRIQVVNAYMTSYKPSFGDKQLSAEVTFKWAPFNKSGTSNKREESQSNGVDQLPASTTSATALP